MDRKEESVRKICIAAIKRHTIDPINYPLTTIFEWEDFSAVINDKSLNIPHHESEFPIALIYFDSQNWTFITTARVITSIKKVIKQAFANTIKSWKWNDFKNNTDKPITYGNLTLDDDTNFDLIIETGNASMVPIYAIMTLSKLKSHNIDKS